jgi:hypothetical protein
MSPRFHVCLPLLLVSLAVGCDLKVKPRATAKAVPAAPAVAGPPAVTEHEAMSFGLQLEAAVAEKDRAAFDPLFSVDGLLKKPVSDRPLPDVPPHGKPMLAELIAAVFLEVQDKAGSYKLVRVTVEGGRPHVLFRMVGARDQLAYHDVTLTKSAAGAVLVDDVAFLGSGETLSRSVRRLVEKLDAKVPRKYVGLDELHRAHAADIVAYQEESVPRKPEQALALFHRLPDELRKDKSLHIPAIALAFLVNDTVLAKEMDAYHKNHPNDPGADLMALNMFFAAGQFNRGLKAADDLKAALGDPYLEYWRAEALGQSERYPEAKAALDAAIRAEPTLRPAYLTRLAVAVEEKDHAETAKLVKAIATRFETTWTVASMPTDPRFVHFVQSKEYEGLKAWAAARARK